MLYFTFKNNPRYSGQESYTDWMYEPICDRRLSKSFSFFWYNSWPTHGKADSTT